MRRLTSGTLILMFLFVLVLMPKVEAANTGTAELIIFHTNDMHARVKAGEDDGKTIGLAEISAAVRAAKAENPDTMWLDAGDTFHGMPAINVSRGENMVTLFNETPLDAITPGNHDFNYSALRLAELDKMLKADMLSANILRRQTSKPFFKAYKIYKLANGIKVGVFGLTTPETKNKTNPLNVGNVDFLSPIDVAKFMVSKLRNKCDVLIALTHIGLSRNSEFTSDRIARDVPGIDLIVDGHSHTALPKGLMVNDTLIVQSGDHGHNLGRAQIKIENHQVVSKSAKLLDAEDVKKLAPTPDPKILATLDEIKSNNEVILNEVIAHSDKQFSAERKVVRRQESELGNLCADAFRWRTGADIAIMNGGGLRVDLPKGDIRIGDVMELFPFDNTIQTALIDGKTIKAMLEHSVAAFPASFGGFLDVSGMTFSFDPGKPPGRRVSDIKINGKPISDTAQYTLAGIDFIFVGGDDYNVLTNLTIVAEFDTCGEILVEYLNEIGLGDPSLGRINMTKYMVVPDNNAGSSDMKEAA